MAIVTLRRALRGWGRFGAGLAILSVAACTNAFLPDNPPSVRGITVPLPPPSFTEATEVGVTIDGQISGAPSAGGFVLLYETVSDDGRFEYPDDQGGFLFEDVTVGRPGNCLQLSEYDGDTDEFGTVVAMKVVVATDEACMDALCSTQDALGACVCLEEWGVGC